MSCDLSLGCVSCGLSLGCVSCDLSLGFCRRVFALRENVTSGEWDHMELCMGGGDTCTDGLVGTERERFILSFGEDEEGELYMLTTSRAQATLSGGVVYRIVDPSRCSPYTYIFDTRRSCTNTSALYFAPFSLFFTGVRPQEHASTWT